MAKAMFKDEFCDLPEFRRSSMAERLLWFGLTVKCNQTGTNGVIPDFMVEDWLHYLGVKKPKEQATALANMVTNGILHDHDTIGDCEDCLGVVPGGELVPGAYYLHAHLEDQPSAEETSDPLQRKIWRRRKRLLRDTELCALIRARDHDRCRYCAIEVNFKARSGDSSGTYDHINPMDFGSKDEPDDGNALHKVVVACRRCNGLKGRNTPEERGMPLLPVPSNVDLDTGEVLADPGPVLAAGQETPGPGQDSGAHAREGGRARDGSGRGQERAGPGGTGSGPGRAGAGRSGSGRRGPGKAGGGPSRRGQAPPGQEPPETLNPQEESDG